MLFLDRLAAASPWILFFRPHHRSLLLFTHVSHFNFPASQKMQRRLLTNGRKNRREIQKVLKRKYKIFDQFGHHSWVGWSNMQRRWFTNPEKAKGPLSNSGQGRFCCFNLYLYIFIFLSSYLVLYCYPIFFISLCLTYLYTFNINIQYVMSIEIDFSKCR